VFESLFGNTQQVAEAIAEGLTESIQVDLVAAGDAAGELDADVALLVAAGPTHGHGMSTANSRKSASAPGVPASGGVGLREVISTLAASVWPVPVPTAVFDTRFDKPRWLTGSAAHSAARLLSPKRYPLVVPPESFFITASTGPLAEGEVDRARRWGESLGAQIAARVGGGKT
jgi:hypothetical protein